VTQIFNGECMPDYLETESDGQQQSGSLDDFWKSAGVPTRAPRSAPRSFNAESRIRELAPSYGLDPDFVLRVGRQESGLQHWGPNGKVKTSDRGAVGVMQVLPETGKKYGYDVYDPEQNVNAGLSEMKAIKDRYGDDPAVIASGYHAGIEDAESALRNPRGNPKTHAYVKSILGNDAYTQAMARYGGQASPLDGFWESAGVKTPDAQAAPLDGFWQKAGIDQPAAPGGQKTIYADELPGYAQQHGYQDSDIVTPQRGITRHVTAEENAATDLFNSGASIIDRFTPEQQRQLDSWNKREDAPVVLKATQGKDTPVAPDLSGQMIRVPSNRVTHTMATRVPIYLGDLSDKLDKMDARELTDEINKRIYSDLGDKFNLSSDEVKSYAQPYTVEQVQQALPGIKAELSDPSMNGHITHGLPADYETQLGELSRRKEHDHYIEQIKSLSDEDKTLLARSLASRGALPDDIKEALGYGEHQYTGAASLPGVVSDYAATAGAGAMKGIGATASGIAELNDQFNPTADWINGLIDAYGKGLQQEGQIQSNLNKPKGVGGSIAEGVGEAAPEVAASLLVPESIPAHLAYWGGLGATKELGRGGDLGDAAKAGLINAAMVGAAEPLKPVAGAVGDAFGETATKATTRATMGYALGYGLARAQGANDVDAHAAGVQFAAMSAMGGKRGPDERLQPIPTEAPPRVRALESPQGMASATAYDAVNPRAGAQSRADYEATRAAEESQQPNNAGMPRMVKRQPGEVPARAVESSPSPTSAIITARGSDPMGTVRGIQDALREGKRVQVVSGGDDAASHELYSALADEFGNHPNVSFAAEPAAQRSLVEPSLRPERAEVPRTVAPVEPAAQSPLDEFWQRAGVKVQAEPAPDGRLVTVNDKQITLTDPEKIQAYDEAQARYSRQLEMARNVGGERGQALRRQAGFEFAATKRQITGELTDKERQAQTERESSFYKGKKVEFELNGRTVTGAVSSTPFGKVRVQLADGRMVTVEPENVRPASGALSTPEDLQRITAPRMTDEQRGALGDLSNALGRNAVEEYTRGQFGKTSVELSQPEARQALADLRKQARAKGVSVGDESGPQSASQFVRSRGGIQYDEMYSGETRRLNSKESETTGLVSRSRSRGLPPDRMREALVESGYLPEDATISDMYNLVERDAAGDRSYSHGDEAYQRQVDDELAAMHEHYAADVGESDAADYGKIEQALSDPEFARLLDRLHQPDATRDDERAFYEAAQKHGINEDFTDETLAFARQHRSQPGGVEDRVSGVAEPPAAAARGETNEAGQRQSDVTHHSQIQPRDEQGQFAGPPDYKLTPKLAEPPKGTEHGYFHYFLHKAEGGYFFNDPSVKAALGLPEDAKSSEVHAKLRDALAPEIEGERPSLSRVSPDELRDWALERNLPDDAIAKLDKARQAARDKVGRNVELGGRADDHPQIIDWRNELGERANDLSFGVNADRALKSAAVLGYDLARGAKDFGAWSKEMVSRLGERIKPMLRSLYDTVRGWREGDEADADDLAHLRDKAARALENQRGAVSLDLLTLGVAPAVRKISADVNKLFAPDKMGQQAEVTGNANRAHRGAYERDVKAAENSLQDLRNSFLRLPEQDQVDFLDRLQNRQPQPTPELQAAHDTLTNLYDAQVRRLAPRQQVRLATDYLSAFWKDAAAAKDFYSKWYQSHPPSDPPTIKDGMQAGLKPRSTNPVDVAMWHFDQARRYQFGQDFMQEMQSKNLAEYVQPGKSPKHSDWVKVDDAIQSKVGAQAGNYYMPEAAARVVNAWLSPGILGRDDILGSGFRGINRVTNWINMFTLGWSAFHGTLTAEHSMVAQFNQALQTLQAGRFGQAAVETAKIPVAVPLSLRLGDRIIKEYNAPGTQPPEIARMVQAIEQAGGRVGEDRAFQTNFRRAFMDAARSGDVPGVAKNALGAAAELGSAGVLGWWVPRLKAAAFARRAQLELDRLGPNASEDVQRAALTKAWDVTDDYFGQLVYDNMFMNNSVKDILKTVVGRFGWQLGTLRAGVGAVADTVATPARAVRAVQNKSTTGNPIITDRMGYGLGVVLLTGLAGGMTTWMLTGQKPKEMADYFYPRTGGTNEDGSPERISFPGYVNELRNWSTKPLQTAEHKISPAIHIMTDLAGNKDFRSVEIRDPKDSVAQQAKDVAVYAGKQILPISVKNYQQAKEEGQSVPRQVAGFLGIKNAPKDIDASDAMALTRQYLGERSPSGAITKDQMAKREAMRDLEKDIRNKIAIGEKVNKYTAQGVLTQDDAKRAIKTSTDGPLVAGFHHLTLEQKLDVMDKASPDERKLLKPVLVKAARSVMREPNRAKRAALIEK
jgi:Transglycosylase SLT domain